MDVSEAATAARVAALVRDDHALARLADDMARFVSVHADREFECRWCGDFYYDLDSKGMFCCRAHMWEWVRSTHPGVAAGDVVWPDPKPARR